MIATKSIVASKFRRFNREYFNNMLPTPIFKVRKSKDVIGLHRMVSYKYTLEKEHYIIISSYYDMQENVLEDVILHEMIHYFIAIRDLKDTEMHGVIFQHYMNEINKNGRNIGIMVKLTEDNSKLNDKISFNVFRFDNGDGRYFEFLVEDRNVEIYKKYLFNRNYRFKLRKVNDYKYSNYRVSRTKFNLYKITKKDYLSF